MTKPASWGTTSEISDALARIAYAMDLSADVAEFMELLASDIEWSFAEGRDAKTPASTLSGKEAVEEWATARRRSRNQGPDSGNRHVVTNVIVDPTSEGSARVRSYFSFYGNAADGPVLKAVGTYEDEFKREGERWLLARRLVRV